MAPRPSAEPPGRTVGSPDSAPQPLAGATRGVFRGGAPPGAPAAGGARRGDEFVLLQGSAAIGAGGRDPFDGLTLEAALALGRLSEREAVALGGDRMTIYGSA